jgi:hypothetical protein
MIAEGDRGVEAEQDDSKKRWTLHLLLVWVRRSTDYSRSASSRQDFTASYRWKSYGWKIADPT